MSRFQDQGWGDSTVGWVEDTTGELVPYTQLLGDPTTEVMLSWIDKSGITDTQAVYLTRDPTAAAGTGDILGPFFSEGGQPIPSRSERIHHVEITGLRAGTEYYVGINRNPQETRGLTVCPKIKTFPAGGQPVRFVCFSDQHIGQSTSQVVSSPQDMDPLVNENADAWISFGDHVNAFSEEYGATNGGRWIDIFENYFDRANRGEYFTPRVASPGNHDVGNHSWTGSVGSSVNPAGTYFRVFFPGISRVEPIGENYGVVRFGKYFQAIMGDTHSAHPEVVGPWLRNNVDEDAPGLVFHHSPALNLVSRQSSDVSLQNRIRRAWISHFVQSPNVPAGFTGHVHAYTRTVPVTFTDTDPQTSNSFEVDDGWLIEGQPGDYQEFGLGWRGNRGGSTSWIQPVSAQLRQYYVVDVDPAEQTFTITTRSETGGNRAVDVFPVSIQPFSRSRRFANGDWEPFAIRARVGEQFADIPVRRISETGEWE